MGWPEPSHSRFKQVFVLEDEPDDELNHASALLFGGFAEVRIGLSDFSRCVLLELQRQVVVVGERPQRVVQEVVALNAELQILRFRHSEILEDSQVGVKVRGSVCDRQQGRAVLANRSWSGKAIAVHVLMLSQMGCGIASDNRIELHGIRSQDGLVVVKNSLLQRVSRYAICSSRKDRAVQVIHCPAGRVRYERVAGWGRLTLAMDGQGGTLLG